MLLPPPQATPQGCVALTRSRAAHALAPRRAPAGAGRGSGMKDGGKGSGDAPGPGLALPPQAEART